MFMYAMELRVKKGEKSRICSLFVVGLLPAPLSVIFRQIAAPNFRTMIPKRAYTPFPEHSIYAEPVPRPKTWKR